MGLSPSHPLALTIWPTKLGRPTNDRKNGDPQANHALLISKDAITGGGQERRDNVGSHGEGTEDGKRGGVGERAND